MEQDTIGQRIAEARAAKKLPRTALGALTGVHPRTVERWEKGDSTPDVYELHRVARACQVDARELLGTPEQLDAELEALEARAS